MADYGNDVPPGELETAEILSISDEYDRYPPELWQRCDELTEDADFTRRLDHPDRELWFVNTVGAGDLDRTKQLLDRYDIDTVYDLGAGDCRLALHLAQEGYDVVAYELNDALVELVRDEFDIDGFELRQRDYYEDYDELVSSDAAVISFGGTNELPDIPDAGLGIEGYCEVGITAYYDGGPVAIW